MAFDLDEKYINALEEILESILPSSYKISMMKSNGGELELEDEVWELFPILDKSNKKRISRSTNHVVYETTIAKKWKKFPENCLAIASNAMGDLLILKKENNQYLDEIYLWSHETGYYKKVADDFSNFEVL